MDYQSHYDRLIARAKGRTVDGPVERHHILPKCLGGSNRRENLVDLTPEEHFVAHQLLAKIYPDERGLTFALVSMSGNRWGTRGNNRLYGWIKRANAKHVSKISAERWKDPEYRAKHRAAMEKVRADPEYGKRLSQSRIGLKMSDEARKNIAEAGRNRKPRKFSDEARRNMSEARRKTWAERRENGTHLEIAQKTKETRIKNGTYEFSDEHRANISKAQIGRTPWNKGLSKKSRPNINL